MVLLGLREAAQGNSLRAAIKGNAQEATVQAARASALEDFYNMIIEFGTIEKKEGDEDGEGR